MPEFTCRLACSGFGRSEDAARVANVELRGGLAIFHGDLDRGFLGVRRGRAEEQGSDQQVVRVLVVMA